ncbi:MAG: hypothetical protein DRI65_13725 [Chloroflexota bacterium]|nr:MAG: hypothetical protein DRI65_13725 [Chloroflexota bacterium]
MTASRLHELRKSFDALCHNLTAGEEYRSWFKTSPAHDGSAHIELAGDTFQFVVTERGSEFERRQTKDAEVVLYWLMSHVTSDMALGYELHNRRPQEDFRRQYFAEQERLLRLLRSDWADAFGERMRDILKAHPFSDPGKAP